MADVETVPTGGPDELKGAIRALVDARIAHELFRADFGLKEAFIALEGRRFQTIAAPCQVQPVFAVASERAEEVGIVRGRSSVCGTGGKRRNQQRTQQTAQNQRPSNHAEEYTARLF